MSKKSVELNEEIRPPNARTDIPPAMGYSVEVDGKLKTQFPDRESAYEAGLDLKKRFPLVRVRIYDAEERTRLPVELPET